ncbi:MAG TPA: protein kinase, partial [Labilithrix sp.]|nr:protein kinase [Labilithrix sp.]
LVIVSRKDGARLLKVIDFGISKVSSQGSSLTNTYGYLGSPSYSAPEQFASTRAMTASGDIWSLGVILYELVCGVSPFVFPGDTLAEMATTITYEPAVPMTQRDPTIDPAFERVVLRCLEKEPANRHARVRELAEAIAPWAGTPPDDLLSRIRRNQPGAIAGHAPSQPQRTADVPAPAIRSSTVALASAPPPQAAAYAPSASMPPPPPGITRYAVAADPPPRAARSSVWIPMTLAALGAVVGIASVAAYRTAHHVVPASRAAPSAVLTAPVAPPEPVASAAASAAPSGTSAVAASVTPSASASSSARTTPSARPTASGRVPPRHPVPAPAESGPKILKDRDGKF